MRAIELYQLMGKEFSKSWNWGKGGDFEITCNGGFQRITGLEFCKECNQYHIISEAIDSTKELTGETSEGVQTEDR